MQLGCYADLDIRCRGFPAGQSARTLLAWGRGVRPDQFYANERSLGEDLPRGGGSGVTCQFRGRSAQSTRFRSSSLSHCSLQWEKFRDAARKRVGKVGDQKPARGNCAKFARRFRNPPNKLEDPEKERVLLF